MNSTFDLLVLAAFFAPMALAVAANVATYRPSRAGAGLLDSPMAIGAGLEHGSAPGRLDLEEMREAA
jgi:hypothetical protein